MQPEERMMVDECYEEYKTYWLKTWCLNPGQF
jgi:hypothetical protein